MKPETMAIVLLRVFGVVTMLAGPLTFLRVPTMLTSHGTNVSRTTIIHQAAGSQTMIKSPSGQTFVNSADGRTTVTGGDTTNYVEQAVSPELRRHVYPQVLLTIGLQFGAQIVMGLILIGASRPLARLICKGLGEVS